MELGIFEVVLGIVGVFFILLSVKGLFKKVFKKDFCVICGAVSLTWVSLLVLNLFGLFSDKVLLGLLMGHTSLGIFYLWEEKAAKKYKVFRLPLLLTLITVFYSVLVGFEIPVYLFLAGLWIVFVLIYSFKNNSGFNVFVNKLVECCRE